MKKYKIGYTSGVYDMFHVGHLNILKNAKRHCDKLIVGVSTDQLVEMAKNKKTIIPFEDRCAIVESVRFVDHVIPQTDYEIDGKIKTVLEIGANVVFVGSDWQGTKKWNELEQKLKEINVDVVYLPHTDGISSTLLRDKIKNENR